MRYIVRMSADARFHCVVYDTATGMEIAECYEAEAAEKIKEALNDADKKSNRS